MIRCNSTSERTVLRLRLALKPCVVAVFPVRVKVLHAKFPERNERKRKWVSLEKAAKLVSEPELVAMLQEFDPKRL